MTIEINRQQQTFDAATMTLADVISACGFPDKGIAAAVNNKVVSRKLWATTEIGDGDCLTVIRAVCGG